MPDSSIRQLSCPFPFDLPLAAAHESGSNIEGALTVGLRALGDRLRLAIGSSGWFQAGLAAIVVLAAAILFVHLFMLLVAGSLLVVLAIWATERILGPGTRIRLRVPPALSRRIRSWMWRKD